MSAVTQMKGARLEFVVRPLKGKVKTVKHSVNPKLKKIEQTIIEEEGGYIVYTPMGNSYRLTQAELVKRGYDRQPSILNFDRVNDTKTPAGRFKFALDPDARKKAWSDMEDEVIRACHRKTGPVIKGVIEHGESAA